MEPQFSPGDLVFIHPHKPPRIGDAVIVQQKNNENGDIAATIGIFRKRNTDSIIIDKHNPTANVKIKRTTIIAIHKVLTVNELLGV